MTIHIPTPRQAQQILTLFRTMPAVEKRQVLEMLKEELTAAKIPLSPLEKVLQEQRPPIIHNIQQLAAVSLWSDDEFEEFLAWQTQEKELNKQLSEERFQTIFGDEPQ